MSEMERVLWNFLFAATSSAAAEAGRFPEDQAREISDCAVKELAKVLTKQSVSA